MTGRESDVVEEMDDPSDQRTRPREVMRREHRRRVAKLLQQLEERRQHVGRGALVLRDEARDAPDRGDVVGDRGPERVDRVGVVEAAGAVVAVPHEEWGTAIVAWVVPKQDAEPTEIDIKRHVADRLPRYMVPEEVVISTGLPKTSTGKIDRVRIREQSSSRQTT